MAKKEYIEREAVLDYIDKRKRKMFADSDGKHRLSIEVVEDVIKDFPAADVAPVRHAKWELIDECINEGVYCSNCHKKIYRARAEYANQKVKSNYCPNCGARMEGDKNAKL